MLNALDRRAAQLLQFPHRNPQPRIDTPAGGALAEAERATQRLYQQALRAGRYPDPDVREEVLEQEYQAALAREEEIARTTRVASEAPPRDPEAAQRWFHRALGRWNAFLEALPRMPSSDRQTVVEQLQVRLWDVQADALLRRIRASLLMLSAEYPRWSERMRGAWDDVLYRAGMVARQRAYVLAPYGVVIGARWALSAEDE